MSDGKVVIETDLDSSGVESGLSRLQGTITKGIAAIGIGKLFSEAVKTGMDFEAQMSRVKAISGATGEEFAKLKEQAKQLGADTAFSATEAAEGMENLASAGFSTSEIIAAMPGMLDLAASSGEDLASSADIAASTLRGFGLEASSAGHVADVLAKNAAETNAAVADTGEAMKYVAPVAKSMGIEFEETAAAIGIMADAGIKGSQAGTTLRGALSRIAKPTKAMQETMDSLGLSFYDSNGKMKSLADITEMLETKMSGLTDEQKNQALITLFGQESLSGMMALMDRGSGEVRKLTDEYKNCDGSAKDMAKTMQDNLSGAVEEFGGSVESLGIEIFENIKGPLKKAVGVGTTEINKLTKAIKNNKIEEIVPKEVVNNIKNLGKMAEVVGKGGIKVLGTAIGVLADNLGVIIPLAGACLGAMAGYKVFQSAAAGVKTLTTAYQGLQAMEKANTLISTAQKGSLTGLQTVVGVLTGKVSAATAATGLFSKAYAALGGPVGVAVVGIGALVAGIVAYKSTLPESISESEKFANSCKKLHQEQIKFSDTVKELNSENKKNIETTKAQGIEADYYFKKLNDLIGAENKTVGQKKQIKSIVEKLNEILPDLNLNYNEEKDKLNQTTDAIKKNIDAQKELIMAKAYQSSMEKTAEKLASAELKYEEAIKKRAKAEKEGNEAAKKHKELYDKYMKDGIISEKENEKLDEYAKKMSDSATAYNEADDAAKGYKDTINDLNTKMDSYESKLNASQNYADYLKNIDKLAKEAGMKASEIPKSIGEGIKNGIYAAPQTGEELKQLISLDELRSSVEKQSKETGVAIPKNLSEGIASGEISFKDAITQMNRLSDFQDAVKKAKIDGKDITDSLTEGIASGKYSVPKSTEELKRLIKFDDLAQKAEKESINIPKGVSKGILSGKYEVPKSLDQLKNLIKFDSIATKATEAGVKIPKSISQGIMSGQYAVPQSVEQMKALVSYDSLVQQAGQKGYQIPEYLSNGVRTGNTKPSTAVNEMKALIQFNDLVAKAKDAGYKVPDNLQKQVLSGKTKPQTAVQQMKNLIKFNDLLSKSSAAGRNVPKNIQQAVMEGRMSPKQAVAAMNNLMTTEAEKTPPKMRKTGDKIGKGYGDHVGSGTNKSNAKKKAKSLNDKAKEGADSDDLYDEGDNAGAGFIDGIESWLSSAFNAGWNLVKNAISGGKGAQESNSPAKKWIEEGDNAGSGYVIGLEKSEKAVNKAGKDMVRAGLKDAETLASKQGTQIGQSFSSNLSNEISRIDLTPELRAMAKKFADTKLNLPVLNVEMRSAMESQLNRIAASKQGKIYQIVQSVSNPNQNNGNNVIFDYDRFERIQRRVAKEQSNRPIYLGTERIDKPLPEGAVPRI